MLFIVGPAYAIGVGAWIASGTTAIRSGAGLLLALLGGLTATLAIDWFVGSREREAVISGGGEWLALAGAIACVVLGGLLHALATEERVR